MNHYGFSCLAVSLFSFLFGIFIFFRNRKKNLNILWGLFEISIAVWCFSQFIESFSSNYEIALGWNRVLLIGVTFIPVFFLHAVIVLLGLKNKKKIAAFYYSLAIIFSFLNLTSWMIKGVVWKSSFGYYTSPGPLYSLFFIFFGITVAYAFFLMFRYYHKSIKVKQQQIKYVMIGSGIGFICGFFNFLPAYNIPTSPFINYIFIFFHFPILYAIVKYRLLDVSIVVTRTGIFIVVYSFVLGIPFVLAFGSRSFLVNLLNENWWMVPLIMSTILATVGPFVYIYIDRKAEARLLKEQKNYQNILRNASKGMIRIKNLKHLLNLIVHVVTKAVKIKNISIYLFDGENSQYTLQAERGLKIDLKEARSINSDSSLISYFKSKNDSIVTEEAAMKLREDEQNIDLKDLVSQLNSLNAALAIPCFLEEKLIGILILGEKRSKKLYSEDDLAVFSVLANQAALAIENAQFYDEIQRTNEQLIQAEKLATIGTMADGLSHQINNRFHALSLISGDSLDVLQTFDFSGCSEKIKEVISDVKVALEKIQNNVLQGGEVVKGLLKYSRPDEGGFESVCLIEVISGAIEMVQYKIKLKEINLVQNIPIDLPKLLGSRIQLQEVFFNLIDNAYDAIKERQIVLKEYGYKGKIEISAVCLDGHVEIVIADNGIGVKEQDRKKLFAPFFTTKASSRKGTGLGLYVIEKIVTAHQGKLSVDSNYGVGTHFVMLLPTAKGQG